MPDILVSLDFDNFTLVVVEFVKVKGDIYCYRR